MATKEQEILTELDKKFTSAIEHETWVSFAKNAKTDFEFREGKQWTEKEKTQLKNRGQPATVENEIKPIIDRLIGQQAKQKTRIIFKGRNLGSDETHANILADLALHIQQQSGYEFEDRDRFDDGAVSGFGVTEVIGSLDDSLQPQVKIKAENCLNIFPDPNSRRYNWNEDAEFICRAKWISYKKAQQLWPKKKKELASIININPVQTNNTQELERNNYVDSRTERVRPVEVWYKEYQRKRVAIGQDIPGGIQEITGFSKKQEKEFLSKFTNVQFLDKIETKMKVGIFCSTLLLEHSDSPYDHNLFPFVPYFVNRKKNGEPYGVVRMLKDPNSEINKRRSKALHLLNTNQSVYEEGAVRDPDEHNKQMKLPDGQISYRKGYKFEIIKNIEVAQSQMGLQAESKQAMARISGVSDESMARNSEVRSGIGIQRKQMMTDLIILPVFENLRRSRKMEGNLIHELIKQYYTEEKAFYVLDDMNKAREITLTFNQIQNIKKGDYDCVVEEMPDTATVQDEQFSIITQLLQGMNLPPNYAMALLPWIIQLSQLRNKKEIMEQVQKLSQPPAESPKMSLNFVWSELTPLEKSWILQNTGNQEIAQAILQENKAPAHVMKEQAGLAKEQMKQGMMNMELS